MRNTVVPPGSACHFAEDSWSCVAVSRRRPGYREVVTNGRPQCKNAGTNWDEEIVPLPNTILNYVEHFILGFIPNYTRLMAKGWSRLAAEVETLRIPHRIQPSFCYTGLCRTEGWKAPQGADRRAREVSRWVTPPLQHERYKGGDQLVRISSERFSTIIVLKRC